MTFFGVAGVASGATLIFSGMPCSPSLREQAGQAPQPCLASTRSATTICCSRHAWWATPVPPKARQVPGVNCRPPLKPLPVLMAQLPVLSHCASLSQTVPPCRPRPRGRRPAGRRSPRRRSPCGRVSDRWSSGHGDDRGSAPWQTSGTAPADLARGGGDGRRCGAPGPFLSRTSSSGSGSRNHRTGRGALRFRDPRAGSPSDRGHATTITALSETWTRPCRDRVTAGPSGPRSPSALLTPRDAQPDRVTPRCVSVTRITRYRGATRSLTPTRRVVAWS